MEQPRGGAPLPPLAAHPFLDALGARTVVLDGAMGTSLQEMALTAADFGGEALEGCNEVLVRTRPDAIDRVHRDFLEVGCHAVETDTFGGAPWVLDEYGLGAETEDLNRRAAEIARAACDAFATPDDPRWVIGSIGPGTRSPTLSLGKDPSEDPQVIRLAAMEDGYRRQVRGLLEGGADVLLVETAYDLLQVKAAVAAANDVFVERGARVPLMVQFTVEKDIDTMLLGTEPLAAVAALDPLAIDVLGINCATGPADMREHVRTLSRASRLPISILPNAGLPELVDGRTVYRLSPDELAAAQLEFVDQFGVAVVGGCCGTTPAHLAAVVEAVARVAPRPRLLDRPSLARPGAAGRSTAPARRGAAAAADARETIVVEHRPALASLYAAVPFEQENTFLAIGER
ncbi:MAG: homocysteine S-methyltransferase family protein, partial [Nitriliruptoraceae bacterium]